MDAGKAVFWFIGLSGLSLVRTHWLFGAWNKNLALGAQFVAWLSSFVRFMRRRTWEHAVCQS